MSQPRPGTPRGDSAPAVLLYVSAVALAAIAARDARGMAEAAAASTGSILAVLCAAEPPQLARLAARAEQVETNGLSFASIIISPRSRSSALLAPRSSVPCHRLAGLRQQPPPAARLQRGDELVHRRLRRLRLPLGWWSVQVNADMGPSDLLLRVGLPLIRRRPRHVPGQCAADVRRHAAVTRHSRSTVRGHHVDLLRSGLRRLRTDRLPLRHPLGARRGRARSAPCSCCRPSSSPGGPSSSTATRTTPTNGRCAPLWPRWRPRTFAPAGTASAWPGCVT